jgi:nucleotide-binding universal stress UspA family protein
MIRDVIVNLGLGARDPAAEVAVSLGEIFDAHVLGLAFAYEPILPGAFMGSVPAELIESQRAETLEKANAAIARFDELARRASISRDSCVLTATLSEASGQLGRRARRFDIVVVGQPGRENTAAEEIVDEGALFESARPVIVVPFIHKGALQLERVMVCWDGSRAATRAIADAMPLMKKAKRIEIVIVGSDRSKSDELPGADLGEHLARHGLKVDVKRITSPDIDVASTILSYAADASTDLIVMGGYGHSRLREFVLGGVTRGILQSMTVPVLMSH